MDFLLTLAVLGLYIFLSHLVAKRGERTGLYYNRTLVLALFFFPWIAIWVYALRQERNDNPYYKI
jgi:hypothetical protein